MAPGRSEFDTELGTVRLACQGSGKVPVVLVAGADDPIARWDALVRHVGQHVLVCRFDPSKATRLRSTPARRADALSWALSHSGLPGPYVLVGHSLGGLTVRRFGADHPDQLASALLLDPTTPVALQSLHRSLTADGWDAIPTQADADESIAWPDVPLIVLAHDPTSNALGGGPVVEMLWIKGQKQYAALSPSGQFEQVDGAGHYIDRDAPNHVRNAIHTLESTH